MKLKKGVSEIVSTVLMVMLVIAAFAIIASLVITMTKDKLTGSTACLSAATSVSLDSESVCYNLSSSATSNSTLFFSLKRGSDSSVNLVKVQVLAYKNDGTRDVYNIGVQDIQLNQIKMYNISYNASIVNYTAINIAPVLKVGNKESLCEAPETKVALTACRI